MWVNNTMPPVTKPACRLSFRCLGVAISAAMLLSACASTTVPELIRKPPEQNPQISQVRENPESYIGAVVRWGGDIVRTENRTETTWVEVIGRDPWRNGRPKDSDASGGRFLARIRGFIDPAVFKKGRQLTVRGKLGQPISRLIGDFAYLYPVVEVSAYYLWPESPKYRDDIYYHDPYWYYPYYPWRHPWHRHHR